MSNELKDIAERLHKDYEADGWEISAATKQTDGSWFITVRPVAKEENREATHD